MYQEWVSEHDLARDRRFVNAVSVRAEHSVRHEVAWATRSGNILQSWVDSDLACDVNLTSVNDTHALSLRR